MSLPWFQSDQFPLYLAPMAGVTDLIFRRLCKEMGADVMVTEFVSAEGILQADHRTRAYTEFEDTQRPVGIQLFGADGKRMGEAAKKIIDWKQPDFIDINFGCPVNKVVAKNGGSSLLKDCPLLQEVASGIVKAVGHLVPVTAKIRIGWDLDSINAVAVSKLLEDCGIQAIAVHGRTRSQGYTGQANWDRIAEVAQSVKIPVIGNGDLNTGEQIANSRQYGVSGAMIGRAALGYPWIFSEARAILRGEVPPEPPTIEARWSLMRRHLEAALEWGRYGEEKYTLQSQRRRLMDYSKGMPAGKWLRQQFSQILSLQEFEKIREDYFSKLEEESAVMPTR